MFMVRLRTYLLSQLVYLILAWWDWRFVSHLHLGRTMLLWMLSGIVFTAYIVSVRYICQGNPWRAHLQMRFLLTHLAGAVLGVVMLTLPMLLLGMLLQRLFPTPDGWLRPVSLLLALEMAILIYFAAVFINYLVDLSRRTQQLEREQLQAEAARAQSALEGLKSAIHPHFLFNVLNMLIPEIHRNPDRAVELVDDLSSFLVLSLRMTENRSVSAREEFRHARLYMDMESRRFGERLQCDWKVHLATADKIMVPPLVILPLLENAVKHGVARSDRPAWIELSCVLDGAWLDIRVANSVHGEEGQGEKAPGLGMGMANLRDRLELYYQGRFALRSERLADRYWVHLRLPLDEERRNDD